MIQLFDGNSDPYESIYYHHGLCDWYTIRYHTDVDILYGSYISHLGNFIVLTLS